jgi:hypothetical protein
MRFVFPAFLLRKDDKKHPAGTTSGLRRLLGRSNRERSDRVLGEERKERVRASVGGTKYDPAGGGLSFCGDDVGEGEREGGIGNTLR